MRLYFILQMDLVLCFPENLEKNATDHLSWNVFNIFKSLSAGKKFYIDIAEEFCVFIAFDLKFHCCSTTWTENWNLQAKIFVTGTSGFMPMKTIIILENREDTSFFFFLFSSTIEYNYLANKKNVGLS